MARRARKKQRSRFYRLNQAIQAQTVRVIDEKGKQVGVLPLSEALQQAQSKGLDLVEVAAKAQPPVCKIINFKKFRFLEEKKRREEKKKAKKVGLKEVRLTPFIADNDFNFRLKRAEEFLKEGDKVKLSVRFRGRQMTKRDFGYELLKKGVERLASLAKVESEPKFLGRQLEMVFSPLKGGSGGSKTKDKKVSQKKV